MALRISQRDGTVYKRGFKMNSWYRLDNAAKLFPATTQSNDTSVFRLSFILKEQVLPDLLQQAVDDVQKRFPTFFVKIFSGIFWNYLRENQYRLPVTQEAEYPCASIKSYKNNYHLIKVLYFNRRISVEVFHALSDATGALELLKTVVYRYLTLCGHTIDSEGLVLLPNKQPSRYELQDSFSAYFKGKDGVRAPQQKAWQIAGSVYDPIGNNVIHGVMEVEPLLKLARDNGTTITAYLAAVLIYSIYSQTMKYGAFDDIIAVAVPINLRKLFPSVTLRNFVGVTNLSVKVIPEFTFEYVLQQATMQLRSAVDKEKLASEAGANVQIEKKVSARIAPLFIKNMGIKYVSKKFGRHAKTITLSNMGEVKLPTDMAGFIERMEFVLFSSKSSPMAAAVACVNGKLTLSFTKNIMEVEIIQQFFSFLAVAGMDILVYSNNFGVQSGEELLDE